MGRVFFSLYGLILATLVGAGFILDQLVGATDEDALHPAEWVATDFAAAQASQLPYTTAEGWTLERLSGADLTNNQTLSELKNKKTKIEIELTDLKRRESEFTTKYNTVKEEIEKERKEEIRKAIALYNRKMYGGCI
jgi:hypothetical protein